MKNGFVKVACATPKVRLADPHGNAVELIRLAKEANDKGVKILVFPELALTGYSCGDLFETAPLLRAAKEALGVYLDATKKTGLISVVGLPFVWCNRLYDCTAVTFAGELLGIVPKTNLPEFGALYEARTFAPAPTEAGLFADFDGKRVPFGRDLLFVCDGYKDLKIAVELGDEVSGVNPPSTDLSLCGATVICNPCAQGEVVAKEEYRRTLLLAQTGRTATAYLSASAGEGESTTDGVFGGRKIVCENGKVLAEVGAFAPEELLVTEIDVERLTADRRRKHLPLPPDFADVTEIPVDLPVSVTELTRPIGAHPFIPDDPEVLKARCEQILSIQARGLKRRIECAYAKKAVIGISGGLDSTLALLVSVRAMDLLGRPRSDVLAVTMPCFGTTARTKNNATVLCEELGVDFRCVNIFDAVNQHFKDIGHDPALRDTTYENAQARERTQVLMDIANDCGGLVVGTGDLSELALGWATYNGDHMAMYGVNASIPKTLIRHVVADYAAKEDAAGRHKIAAALRDVLDTPVSPELLPADRDGAIAQKTEDLVGPYELHDFYLYYFLRFGFSPAKLYRMAKYALGDRYDDETLKKWLKTFCKRFFAQQFKRSCLPDGPKVGSVGVSPRGDLRMPSDALSAAWVAEAEKL